MFHGILRRKTDAHVCSYKRGVHFGTAVSGTAERKTENYVPEMTSYSLSKSARLK